MGDTVTSGIYCDMKCRYGEEMLMVCIHDAILGSSYLANKLNLR